MMRKALIAILTAIALPTALAAQTLSPEVRAFVKVDAPVIALTHVRVIDGTGAPVREDQTLVLSHGKMKTTPRTDPAPMLVNKSPRLDGLRCNTFKPTTGINAGIAEMNRENRKLRANTT